MAGILLTNGCEVNFFFCIFIVFICKFTRDKQRKNHTIILVLQFYIEKGTKKEKKEVKRSITL